MTQTQWILLAVATACVLLAALFTTAESALSSISRSRPKRVWLFLFRLPPLMLPPVERMSPSSVAIWNAPRDRFFSAIPLFKFCTSTVRPSR